MGNATRVGKFAAGIALALGMAAPALAATATIEVPTDFVAGLSDTRSTGHYEVMGTGLHVWTEGSTSTDKVAEYVATNTPLADAGEPSLSYAPTTGTIPPGYQLVVDFDNDGTGDGILVGEPTYYGNDWWLNGAAAQFVKDGAPVNGGGSGSPDGNHGTLNEWRAAFPDAQVLAFGFSLGSGVLGDGVISSIDFAGDTYTFAQAVELSGKDDCKNGGWATSTAPVFKNQGDCVSHFANAK